MSLKRLNAEPDGFCRINYKAERGARYCYQQDTPKGWTFYACSRDGEPSHEVLIPGQPNPPGGLLVIGPSIQRAVSRRMGEDLDKGSITSRLLSVGIRHEPYGPHGEKQFFDIETGEALAVGDIVMGCALIYMREDAANG